MRYTMKNKDSWIWASDYCLKSNHHETGPHISKLAIYENIDESTTNLRIIKKAFDIMKNKEVDVHKLLDVECLEHYNLGMIGAWKLTEKEYELVRKALDIGIMKKKYCDLTIKEVQEICKNHAGCIDCPIYEICPRRFDAPEDWKECLNDEVEL